LRSFNVVIKATLLTPKQYEKTMFFNVECMYSKMPYLPSAAAKDHNFGDSYI
jgi:hypothetical protein